MKKLFFAAAVAVVAIGGALSTTATTYYGVARPSGYNCSQTTTLCSSISEPLWLVKANVGNGNPDIPTPSAFFTTQKYN